MDFRNCRVAADKSLSAAQYDPKKLTVIHTGAALLLWLVISILHLALSEGIATTGGLSGIGTRTVLELIQSVLSLFTYIALPFWELGFVFAVIGLARRESVTPSSLFQGFHRFGPALRLFLLQILMYTAVALACMNVASMLFAMTPFAAPLMELMMPMLESTSTELPVMDADMAMQVMKAAIPAYVIFFILFALVSLFLSYRFRMSRYAIMDEAPGALAALVQSTRMMKGHSIALFRQDLRFWWYYAIQVILSLLSVGDIFLAMAGVVLPVNGIVLSFVFFTLSMALNLAFAWKYKAHVETAYACCYEVLKLNLPAPTPEHPPVLKEFPQ